MKALNVDLRTPSHPPRWAWIAVAVALFVAASLIVSAAWQARKLAALEAQRDALLKELRMPVPAPHPVARKMPYDASAREMLALATSEWPAMLTALESVELVGVTPVAIEIAPAERWVRVDVEFADYAALLQYVDGLNAGEAKPRWALVQAQMTARSGGAASVASVKGTW